MSATYVAPEEAERQINLHAFRFFMGPLWEWFQREDVNEIMVNGKDTIFVEHGGDMVRAPVKFRDEDELLAAARNIAQQVGRTISAESPILDARLVDGSRVCIVLPPVAGDGVSISIRKFRSLRTSPDFGLPEDAKEMLRLAVHAKLNIIVSGGTGSGKTTLVNELAKSFRKNERIIVIEDTRELQIHTSHPHVVRLEARPGIPGKSTPITIRDLFVTSLRMRPDRIVVGEVRRGEAFDMIQAMSSGHGGSVSTLHASTPAQAATRLETMAMMAESGLPVLALRRQVAAAVDLVVQVNRIHEIDPKTAEEKSVRRITHLSALSFDEEKNLYDVRDLYTRNSQGRMMRTAESYPASFLLAIVEHNLSSKIELCTDLKTAVETL